MELSAKVDASGNVDPRITSWTEKNREKYHYTRNEIMRLMAFIISRTLYKKDNYLYFLLLYRACNTA